uniref:Uncharacterized protein n=1 Tax=uncultured delta proteobacterium HF0130_05G09 TaxID=710827 RepID=E0XXN0_9DELT|nr:hypothetical protein [uncultured delta proteobacterium HF0130_05G09]
MAENIFDRIVIERVDLDITIGPKTFILSGNKEFINLATRNKTDLFFLLKEIVKKIGFIRTFKLYTKFPGKIKISEIH